MVQRHPVEATRQISYADGVASRGGRGVIRLLETATGKRRLLRRARGYEDLISDGRSFWDVVPERFGLTFEVMAGSLSDIPLRGPLIVVSNHPFGILDGLMLGHLLDTLRGDFRILANAVLNQATHLDRVLLPISFAGTREAAAQNLATRDAALAYLADGGAIGVFPGGTVSTARRPFGPPMDPAWRNFTAKMIARSGATVVPLYFDGQNSRLFQIASHLHYALRLGLLIREFRRRVDTTVPIAVGRPIPAEDLQAFAGDASAMMAHLRAATYALSPAPLRSYDQGYEFEARYRPLPG
jgi:putative hemolysin